MSPEPTAGWGREIAHGVLDILANNAGILPAATGQPREAVDGGLFRQTFEINLHGVVKVTEHLLPLLRASDAREGFHAAATRDDPAVHSEFSSRSVGRLRRTSVAVRSTDTGRWFFAKRLSARHPIITGALTPVVSWALSGKAFGIAVCFIYH